MIHHSVQEEWIFYTKQLELAKFYYKHFQWHYRRCWKCPPRCSRQSLARFRTFSVLNIFKIQYHSFQNYYLAIGAYRTYLEHLVQHASAHLPDIQLCIARQYRRVRQL